MIPATANPASRRPSQQLAAVCCALLAALLGCSGSGPARVAAPSWSPSSFSSTIMSELDKNGDSQIDKTELAAAPGLQFGARFIDTDGNGQLSSDELTARFETYKKLKVGLAAKEFRVIYKGRPLPGAEVKFVPEFFLTDVIEPATGTTDNLGIVRPTVENQPMALMRVGYYRVEVTSPRAQIPAQFNTATKLGVEVPAYTSDPTMTGTIDIVLRD